MENHHEICQPDPIHALEQIAKLVYKSFHGRHPLKQYTTNETDRLEKLTGLYSQGLISRTSVLNELEKYGLRECYNTIMKSK